MHNSFDRLINSFIDNNIGIAPGFLDPKLVHNLKDNLHSIYTNNLFKLAGTGNKEALSHDKRLRSDVIYWLDREHGNVHENRFFDLIDQFVAYLNETCYTSVTNYEFHYALYETGSFYKRHVDRFHTNSDRKYSMIFYLNDNWLDSEGGELRVYQHNTHQDIFPISGQCVFFDSGALEHEVRVSSRPRMSITGWLKTN